MNYYYSGTSAAPMAFQSPAPQQGLAEILPIVDLVFGILNRFGGGTGIGGGGGGGGGSPPPTADSDSLRRAGDSLARVEKQLDRLEKLVDNRLARVEEDVATLQKAQKETFAQIDQRLVKNEESAQTIGKVNADLIKANTDAIKRTQRETAFLISNSQLGLDVKTLPLTGQITATTIDGKSETIASGTSIELLLELGGDSQVIRWTKAGVTMTGVAKKSDLK